MTALGLTADGVKVPTVREANAAQLVTRRVGVPTTRPQQVVGLDPNRHQVTLVNEGTVVVYVSGSQDGVQFASGVSQGIPIPTGGERTFGVAGPIYAQAPPGGADGVLAIGAEQDA